MKVRVIKVAKIAWAKIAWAKVKTWLEAETINLIKLKPIKYRIIMIK